MLLIMSTSSYLFRLTLLMIISCVHCEFGAFPRVLDDLSTHKDLRQFTQLIRDSDLVRRYLRNREVTILAPTDAAFETYRGRIDESFIMYHMLPLALSIEGLLDAGTEGRPLKSISENLPYLWPSCTKEMALYINDATVIRNDSNHQSRSRGDSYGKLQIVHKIIKVLSPMTTMATAPTAYDFLSQTTSWPLISYTFNNFLKRVITTSSVPLYKDSLEGHTFLMPADEFRTALDDLEITQEAISCAISPLVIYTSDETEESPHDAQVRTLHRDCFLSFSSKIVIIKDPLRSHTKVLRILLGNIPLRNGVAHIVDLMPGVWKPKMAPRFPIRSIWSQINNDYFLQICTQLLANLTQVDFQNVRNDTPQNFTLFLIGDKDWLAFLERNERTLSEFLSDANLERFMMRHISHGVYDIKRLLDVTRTSLRGDALTMGTGEEKIIAKFEHHGDQVGIVWGTQRLKILRGDIYCSNGIIHIIDAPFIFDSEIKDEGFSLLKLWKAICKLIY